MKLDIKTTNFAPGIKGINMEAWGGIENFLRVTSIGQASGERGQQLRRVIPWLAKAVDMTAGAVSELPFEILSGKTVIDTTADWQNKLGGIPNPKRLIRQIAASLCMGRAYAIPEIMNRVIVDVQYCAPQTVAPFIDQEDLRYFQRQAIGKVGRFYPIDHPLAKSGNTPEGYEGLMMYFWLPDPDVEIGQAETHPVGTAILSTELILGMDATIRTNAERGFIPPTLLATKGMTTKTEAEKTETFWNRFLRGWDKMAAKIINAEAMDVKRVGSGMDELNNVYSEVYTQAIENIGTAFGIPAAIFMSDKSFASEVNQMTKIWYTSSVFNSIYSCIEETFTDQLLSRYDAKMKFRLEGLEAFQEEEVDRSNAVKTYADLGLPLSVAFQICGVDLPEGITPESLDKAQAEKQEAQRQQAEMIAQSKQPPEKEDKDDKEKKPVNNDNARALVDAINRASSLVEAETKSAPVMQSNPLSLNSEQIKELNLWRQIAQRQYNKSGNKCLDFECKSLATDMQDSIRERLNTASTELDIIKAFEIGSKTVCLTSEQKSTGEEMEFKFVIPPQKSPDVYLQIPENLLTQVFQPAVIPAPVVNVTNQVEPTPIEVVNKIKVEPTPVTVQNTNHIQLPEKQAVGAIITRQPNGDLKITPKE